MSICIYVFVYMYLRICMCIYMFVCIGQDLNSLHHMEQYITIPLQRQMRPSGELTAQRKLQESEWY